MRIIPAIDIIDGKCVRLTKGDYNEKKIYNENPLEVAKAFEDHGIKYLHLVDLDGAKARRIINHKVLETIASKTNLHIDFGGGLRSDQDLETAFSAGAKQITGGSIASKNPQLFKKWLSDYGADRIILGADCKNRKIAISGWETTTEVDILDYIKRYETAGIKYVVCTDIDKDGMLAGCSTTLYEEIVGQCNINLVASGGVSSIDDLIKLKATGCEAAIVGKAIYERRISLKELAELC